VEGEQGDKGYGADDDDGSGEDQDPDAGDDMGIEELDHDSVPENRPPLNEKADRGDVNGSGGGTSGKSGSGRKVASWASLFQSDEADMLLEASELGHYSCTKLLREMEAIESDGDDDMSQDEHELCVLPTEWCHERIDDLGIDGLPENPFSDQEVEMQDHEMVKTDCNNMSDKGHPKAAKTKWGPTLVDKRPRKKKPDGRTVLEKAQERKKTTNLEVKGISKHVNSFHVLSHIDIIDRA
jgi:hypothetical protein